MSWPERWNNQLMHFVWAETSTLLDLPQATQAQQGVVSHSLDLVPLQVNVSQVLHAPDGSGNPAEIVLKAEELLECHLLNEDAVGDVEEVTVGQVQAHQLLQPSERPRMKVADVEVVGHFQLHQVGKTL